MLIKPCWFPGLFSFIVLIFPPYFFLSKDLYSISDYSCLFSFMLLLFWSSVISPIKIQECYIGLITTSLCYYKVTVSIPGNVCFEIYVWVFHYPLFFNGHICVSLPSFPVYFWINEIFLRFNFIFCWLIIYNSPLCTWML